MFNRYECSDWQELSIQWDITLVKYKYNHFVSLDFLISSYLVYLFLKVNDSHFFLLSLSFLYFFSWMLHIQGITQDKQLSFDLFPIVSVLEQKSQKASDNIMWEKLCALETQKRQLWIFHKGKLRDYWKRGHFRNGKCKGSYMGCENGLCPGRPVSHFVCLEYREYVGVCSSWGSINR